MTRFRWVRSSLFNVVAGLVMLLLCSSAVQAITIPLSLSELTGLADTVVLGTVVNSSSQWNAEHNNIYTEVIVSVSDSLKGSAGKNTITIIVPGGTVGEITQWVEDTATFETGEQVGLFLQNLSSVEVSQMGLDSAAQMSDAGAAGRIIGGLQGKLSLAKDSLIAGNGISAGKFKQDVQMALAGQIVPEEENQHIREGGVSNIYDISTISPTSASAGTNTLVTVTGSGFGTTRGTGDDLMFYYTTSGGTNYYMAANTYVSWSDTQIQAYVPVCNTCLPTNGYSYSAASGPVRVLKGATWGTPMDFTVTFGNMGKRWTGDSPNISYKVNEGGVAGRSEAIQAGATSWTNAGAKFRYTYGGAHIQTVKSLNGVNEVLWMSLPAGVLGQATTWFSGSVITECDFAFATDYIWSSAAVCPSGQYDIQSIGTHEMGHWLSLRDLYGNYTGFTQDIDKVMYGRSDSGTSAKRVLHAHDILGIQWIYGASPPTPTAVSSLLWAVSDGSAVIWTMDAGGNKTGEMSYGPYTGWTARSYHRNSDGTANMLWVRNDGYVSLWTTDAGGNITNQMQYGPYTDWTARSYHRNSDGTANMLWVRTDGYVSLWTMDTGGNPVSKMKYGPYTDWTAAGYHGNGDGTANMLWVRTDGYVSLWTMDAGGNPTGKMKYGPYTDWTAKSYYRNSDGTGRMLWVRTDGYVSLWMMDTAGNPTAKMKYGPYTGWAAQDYD